jgi:hypothetical protein
MKTKICWIDNQGREWGTPIEAYRSDIIAQIEFTADSVRLFALLLSPVTRDKIEIQEELLKKNVNVLFEAIRDYRDNYVWAQEEE